MVAVSKQCAAATVASLAAAVSNGLLGGKFIDLQPGTEETLIRDGGRISYTQSSLLLEELIGQFAFGTD